MSNKSPINPDWTLRQLQDYVWQMNQDRGFNLEDADKKMLMLTEEVGELAKAIRKHVGLKFDDSTATKDIDEELADVMIVLLGLASLLDRDITRAVSDKEAKNDKRQWN